MGKTLAQGHRGCVEEPELEPRSGCRVWICLATSLGVLCHRQSPPGHILFARDSSTNHPLPKGRMEILHLHMPSTQQRAWPKAGAQQGWWMDAHRKEVAPGRPSQKPTQPTLPIPDQNLQTIYSAPWGLLLRKSTSREGSAATLLGKGEVGFSKYEQFIFRLVLLSVSPSCPGANNSSLSHP